ncbi:MAG: hypothetical protein ABL962_10160 [Fimbriimonadaceae bacterium]
MTSLVIPAAKLVDISLQLEYGPIPPLLVPLRGKVALELIAEKYSDTVDRIYVVCMEGADQVQDYVEFFKLTTIKLVVLKESRSLGDTLNQLAILHPEVLQHRVVVNLADTLISDLDLELVGHDFVACGATRETARWTLFNFDEDRNLVISDKQHQDDPSLWSTFLGVWGFEDYSTFAGLLAESSSFYDALKTYCDRRSPTYFEAKQWIDFGHLDNLNRNRRRSINSRYFNSLEFGHGGATLRKESQRGGKLIDEINWFLALPEELKPYTPRIYRFSVDPIKPWVEMEFYSYPSLDECFVYGRHDLDTWEQIFEALLDVVATQGKYKLEAPDLACDLEEMYLTKTTERLQEFLSSDPAIGKVSKPTINGVACLGLETILERLPAWLKAAGTLDAAQFQIIHGDMCFGNILFEARHHLLKFIDARGRFGRHGIYGDSNYDLAKLCHSVVGHYDFFVFGQYQVGVNGTDFMLKTRANSQHEHIGRIYLKHLRREGYNLTKVRAIEALLFLSMLPLHSEDPQRQLAFALRGIELASQSLEEAGV